MIFITGQLDEPSHRLQKAAKKVHDSGGKIVAYKLNDISDDVLVRVIPKDQIIKVDAKDDPWRLAMLFDFQTRKGENLCCADSSEFASVGFESFTSKGFGVSIIDMKTELK